MRANATSHRPTPATQLACGAIRLTTLACHVVQPQIPRGPLHCDTWRQPPLPADLALAYATRVGRFHGIAAPTMSTARCEHLGMARALVRAICSAQISGDPARSTGWGRACEVDTRFPDAKPRQNPEKAGVPPSYAAVVHQKLAPGVPLAFHPRPREASDAASTRSTKCTAASAGIGGLAGTPVSPQLFSVSAWRNSSGVSCSVLAARSTTSLAYA